MENAMRSRLTDEARSVLGEAVIFSKHCLTTSVLATATVKGSSTGAIAQTASKITTSDSREQQPLHSLGKSGFLSCATQSVA